MPSYTQEERYQAALIWCQADSGNDWWRDATPYDEAALVSALLFGIDDHLASRLDEARFVRPYGSNRSEVVELLEEAGDGYSLDLIAFQLLREEG